MCGRISNILYDYNTVPPVIKFMVEFHFEFILLPVDPSLLRFHNVGQDNFVRSFVFSERTRPLVKAFTPCGNVNFLSVAMDSYKGFKPHIRRKCFGGLGSYGRDVKGLSPLNFEVICILQFANWQTHI